jgi:hypothetical protein
MEVMAGTTPALEASTLAFLNTFANLPITQEIAARAVLLATRPASSSPTPSFSPPPRSKTSHLSRATPAIFPPQTPASASPTPSNRPSGAILSP